MNQQAIDLHKKNKGKYTTASLVPLESKEDLALAYTPGVADVSMTIAQDTERVYDLTMKGRTIAIVSDGSAVLGLGNIGPEGALPVMEGKAVLMKKLAGIDVVPLCIRATESEKIISFVQALEPTFGGIILEDISAPRCFEIEKTLRKTMNIPVVHDDQHAIAIAVLAGLISINRIRPITLSQDRIVILGAGAAGIATAQLLYAFGYTHIVLTDSKGIIDRNRTDLPDYKQELLSWTNPENISGTLTEALRGATVCIGMSVGNTVTQDMVASMQSDPIIFGLANPVPEIYPEEARKAGARFIATGRSDFPNQINNALVYPGLYKGMLQARIQQPTQDDFIRCAKAIASVVNDPQPDFFVPDVLDPQVIDAIANVFMQEK